MSETPFNPLPRAVGLVHQLLRDYVRVGDAVVDATCGNGHDAAFLAQRISSSGHLYAFDVQAEAIKATERRLANLPYSGEVTCLQECHSQMQRFVTSAVRAITFNLGYLPGSDKSCLTRPETTILALSQSIALLEESGILTVAAYAGHEGGREEARAVHAFMENLPQEEYEVVHYGFLNQRHAPPEVYAVVKKRGKTAK